jgi:hypothetical protein
VVEGSPQRDMCQVGNMQSNGLDIFHDGTVLLGIIIQPS